MAVEQLAAELELDGKHGYFEYIIDSISWGQRSQARELFENLTLSEAEEFFEWAETSHYYEADSERVRQLEMESLRLTLSR